MKTNNYDKLNELISRSSSRSFSDDFTRGVMSEIYNLGSKVSEFDMLIESLTIQFKRFALTGVLMIVLIISYNIITGGEVTLAKAFDMPEYSVEEALDPVSTIYWSDK